MNVFIEKFKNLDITVQEFILKGFNQYIVDSGKCSSLRGAEDDYNYQTCEYYIYRDQFRLWLGSYFYYNEHSLERLLERTKVVLTTRDREHKEVPLGITVDRYGFCYCLRTVDDIPLRSLNLKELKDHWDTTLRLNEGI